MRRIEFDHIERILDLAAQPEGHGRLRLPGVDVTRSFDWMRVERPAVRDLLEPVNITVPGTYALPGGIGEIRFQIDEIPGPGCANLKLELAVRMKLRAWRPGDHYRPVGKSRDHKLREMFQSARIPSWRRAVWPIVESDGNIVWAKEFGAAEEYAADRDRAPVLRIWEP